MSENTYGKDLVDSLKEPVLEDPVALCAEAAAEIERLRAENEKALADRSEILRAADRLHVAASEALHCIASKGWRASDGIEWSVAGCQKHLHRELDGATDDMRVVLEAKNPSELERRGPYADVVRECERLRASEAQAVAERERVCTWTKEDEGPWHTECDNAFEFTVDGPTENEFKHCCYCGGKIIVKDASDAER